MKKNKFLILAASIVLLSACDSKMDKLTDETKKDLRDYTDAFNNAKSRDEVRAIERDLKSRGDYYESELEKIEHELSIKDKQKFIQDEELNNLSEELKEARRNARNKFD